MNNNEVQVVTETANAVGEVAVKSGMSTGTKIGLATGGVALVGLTIFGIIFGIKRHKAKKTANLEMAGE